MAIRYPVKLALTLEPVGHTRPIPVGIRVDQNSNIINLKYESTFNFEFHAENTGSLVVEIFDKKDQEAIIVKKVSFFDIEDPRFAWAGIYEPKYPEPWASQQRLQGIDLNSTLCSHTYLSWPGKWTLTFDIPVFTWIHKTQNLGWIYA